MSFGPSHKKASRTHPPEDRPEVGVLGVLLPPARMHNDGVDRCPEIVVEAGPEPRGSVVHRLEARRQRGQAEGEVAVRVAQAARHVLALPLPEGHMACQRPLQ